MRRFAGISPLLLLFVFLLFTPEARADGLVITSGSIDFNNRAGGLFTFSGQGFTLNGGINFAPTVCAPCTAGQATSVDFYRLGGDIRGGFSGMMDGVTYDRLYYTASMQMQGDPIFVPNDTSSIVTLIVPFTFSASMLGCAESTSASDCASPIFSTLLSGQGFATLQLQSYLMNDGTRLYDFRSVSYNFGTGAPVPEPATLVLLGTGLAGVAVRLRRRSRSKSKD
ncbi:MAG: PEP-CTERM sorting domain-containing protein [Pyrinomonadaceae bacterium]|nr:PEP-CTERM sorting domain-containing protein [Pyrinomonadaceae bacterium]